MACLLGAFGLVLTAGCGSGEGGEDEAMVGFHASGRGDALPGKIILVLRDAGRPFTCNREENGTYIAVYATGGQAADYSHFPGPMDQIPALGFQAVLQDIVNGDHLNKRSSNGGTLKLDQDATGAVLHGTLDIAFANGTRKTGDFTTNGCDIDD